MLTFGKSSEITTKVSLKDLYSLGLTLDMMDSSSTEVKLVGRVLTASMKLKTLVRRSEASVGGVNLKVGLDW